MTATLVGTEQIQGNVLRIHGEGQMSADAMSQFLADMSYVYNCLYVFESISNKAARLSDRRREIETPISDLLWLSWWPPTPDRVSAMVPDDQKLIVSGVELHSPGAWDFLGKLNLFEVLRLYLNDRHERQKDNNYRNEAEQQKLWLENLERENRIIAERVNIIRDLGATEDDLKSLKDQLLYRPLQKLDASQNSGLIGPAEIIDPDAEKKKSA